MEFRVPAVDIFEDLLLLSGRVECFFAKHLFGICRILLTPISCSDIIVQDRS